jgi:hypothetical protein
MGDSSTQFTKDYQFLEEVRYTLNRYKRIAL